MCWAMTYELDLDLAAAEALRRAIGEELESAVERLRGAGDADRAKAVHEARKHIKKTRAALELARGALDKRAHRSLRAALRDTAQGLAGQRDADVMLETIDGLAEHAAGRLPASTFKELREAVAERALAGGAVADTAAAAEALSAVARQVADLPLEESSWRAVRAAVARTYAAGLAEWESLAGDPAGEARHEWRKRVKALWYHHRLLRPVWPAVMDAYIEELDRLGDNLGREHDLDVLEAYLTEHGETLGTRADAGEVVALIGPRRAALREEAAALGRRVYAEPPKAFDRRLRGWLRAARSERAGAA
jgi:CHAD domain-containing protein